MNCQLQKSERLFLSPNPQMFRCFMNIQGNEQLKEQMSGLFDVGLSLCNQPDMQEYSSYLLKLIYLFFVTTDNGYYISELRKKVRGITLLKEVSSLTTS